MRAKKTISVRLIGGLGNQLQCYAFGYAVATHNQADLELDTESGYWDDQYGRQYLLDLFPRLTTKKKKLPRSRLARLILRLTWKLRLGLNSTLPLSRRSVIKEESPFRYREDIHRTKYRSNPYFIGYWASHRYYKDVSAQLRSDLAPPKPDHPDALRILNEIKSGRSCSIHLRSYVEEVDALRPPLKAYYRCAVALMEDKCHGVRFFVFSDDPSLAREELSGIKANAMIVDIGAAKGNKQSLIDFYLMYSCDHAIIGDSSFSWWAAWLSDNNEKVVIAPRGLSPWGDDWTPRHWTTVAAEKTT